jgi:hypothetical protein
LGWGKGRRGGSDEHRPGHENSFSSTKLTERWRPSDPATPTPSTAGFFSFQLKNAAIVHERQHHTPLLPPHLDNPALLLSFFL